MDNNVFEPVRGEEDDPLKLIAILMHPLDYCMMAYSKDL